MAETEMFEEGGLTDDGMNVDPVSGNEVPVGSMASEVRDDIDARLSEGEYVIPADVVRYIGLGQIEKMVQKAKTGLEEMDANGRIGGEPMMDQDDMAEVELPFDENELKELDGMVEQEFATGGLVKGFADGGMAEREASVRQVSAPVASPYGVSYEDYFKIVPYKGPNGEIVQVQFVGGVPQPPYQDLTGYTKVSTTGEKFGGKKGEEKTQAVTNNDDEDGPTVTQSVDAPSGWDPEVNFSSVEEVEKYINEQLDSSFVEKGAAAVGTVVAGPIGGAAVQGITQASSYANAEAAAIVADAYGLELSPETQARLDAAANTNVVKTANTLGMATGVNYAEDYLKENPPTEDTPAPTPTPTPATPSTGTPKDSGDDAPTTYDPEPELGFGEDTPSAPSQEPSYSEQDQTELSFGGNGGYQEDYGDYSYGLDSGASDYSQDMEDNMEDYGISGLAKGGLVKKRPPNKRKKTTKRGKRGLGRN